DGPDLSSLEEEPGLDGPAPSWNGEAPPVRRDETAVAAAPSEGAPALHRGRGKRLALVALLLTLLGGFVVGGIWLVGRKSVSDEAARATRAEELYRKEEFGEAAAAWQRLQREFPRSADYARYGFLAELSAVRDAAATARSDPAQGRAALDRAL